MKKQNIKLLFPANMSYPIISIGSFYRSKNKGGESSLSVEVMNKSLL